MAALPSLSCSIVVYMSHVHQLLQNFGTDSGKLVCAANMTNEVSYCTLSGLHD